MKIYFNGFWDGFIDKTNPVHCQFFLDLASSIWNQPIEIGTKETSEILCESIFGASVLSVKQWKYSILFSGESRLQKEAIDHLYTIVLYGQRNNGNRINCPLFLPYLHCNKLYDTFQYQNPRTTVSQNAVLAIISNPNGSMRNTFLDALEKRLPVCYAGAYKNNMGQTLVPAYSTPEFIAFVSTFKYVIAMENSREDTYITEKICHGLLAQTVPIYWGSPRVNDYFNKDRFLCIKDEKDIESVIDQVVEGIENDEKWLHMVNKPIYTNNTLWLTLNSIAEDCRNVLMQHAFKPIQKVYFICKEEFEAVRYQRLQQIAQLLNLPKSSYTFLCPTYKQTITDEEYTKYVRTPFKQLIPWCDRNLRRSELSLLLNFRAVLEEIDKKYMDGMFLILESDVVITEDIDRVQPFFEEAEKRKMNWECIHIGHGNDEQFWQTPFQETLTKEGDSLRLSRHLNTRCTDSMLWTKQGIERMLEYMMQTEDYSEPLDHYICRYLENNQEKFSFYWSRPTFFKQLTTYGGEESTIQKDKN